MRAVSRQDRQASSKTFQSIRDAKTKHKYGGVQTFPESQMLFSTNVLIVLQLNSIEQLSAEHFEK